ncbi:cuticle protein 1-like [Ischnura elegans]|uniref:cuticle protein 1-like n=1 Tax=Ischnura elegans TaxID=197161 RepID=UPI001ED8B06E|nr:cuticle protein 1-like [Ischnura elegans]
MAARLMVLALCVAAVIGGGAPGARYPAGVDPHTCPNYPYCDNGALAVHHGAIAPYAAAPAYGAYGLYGPAGVGAGAKYPAGVSPHTCPNYPYCGPTPAHGGFGYAGYGYGGAHGYAGAYAAPVYGAYGVYGDHGAGARYPAGVDPHSCPNYPYCH